MVKIFFIIAGIIEVFMGIGWLYAINSTINENRIERGWTSYLLLGECAVLLGLSLATLLLGFKI